MATVKDRLEDLRWAGAHYIPSEAHSLASIAISLKRLADVAEARAAGDFNYSREQVSA